MVKDSIIRKTEDCIMSGICKLIWYFCCLVHYKLPEQLWLGMVEGEGSSKQCMLQKKNVVLAISLLTTHRNHAKLQLDSDC